MLLRSRSYWVVEGAEAWPDSPSEDDAYRRYSSISLQELADHIAKNIPKGFRVSHKAADKNGWKVSLKLTSREHGEHTVRIFTSSSSLGMIVRVIGPGRFLDRIFKSTDSKKMVSSWVNDRLVVI